jgi:hypothetical protein
LWFGVVNVCHGSRRGISGYGRNLSRGENEENVDADEVGHAPAAIEAAAATTKATVAMFGTEAWKWVVPAYNPSIDKGIAP